ncbi:MAG: UDP-N-acetylglucosamine 2-epimerase (non-hydrolyzing) [Clostridia bacterium]|nr:UDP-N-acetylglucosamine 2-epimerase (non-hydrolyzing) [Clostridia bacterium]
MKKIMLVFGTRPEAIKMCPLVSELKRCGHFEVIVAVTGQHRELLDAVLRVFDITPDYDLAVMKEGQTLFDVTSAVLCGMERVLEKASPDLVLVHGDTTTAFAAALAAYYKKIPVGHVEAGLRTGDLYAPYPEEFNRLAIGNLAAFHFSPTEDARANLLNEGKAPETVYVTGNTAIDALKTTVRAEYTHPLLEICGKRRLILLTAHRRENVGAPMERIFSAVKTFAAAHEDVFFVYPVHPSPAVRKTAYAMLSSLPNVALTEPLSVVDFHNFMARATLVLTDSGGAQEEAPFFGVPVLVMRETTERPEGIRAGTAMLVGTEETKILQTLEALLSDAALYRRMATAKNPYGDGFASQKICEILVKN